MPLVAQRRPAEADDGLVGDVQSPVKQSAREGDAANDPADLSTWFAVYLAVLLLSMLGMGGLWISYFAL